MRATLSAAVAATLFTKDAKGQFIPLAGPVDLKGASVQAGEGEAFAVLISAGDADKDGNPDVTVAPSVNIPFLGAQSLPPKTFNVPMDQALALVQAAAPALSAVPGAGPLVAEGVKDGAALARFLFKKL